MDMKLATGRIATLISVFSLMVVALSGVTGCDMFGGGADEAGAPTSTGAPAAPAASGHAIEPIEGMKYYVGGPVMGQDEYGRMRVKAFNGEVKKPTSRGLVIGHKVLDENRFELRTWLNGDPVTAQFGFVDENGLFWYDERSTLNADGVVIVRQKLTYDDDKEVMHSKVEYIDPADGEIVKTYESDILYRQEDEEEDDEKEEGDAAEEGTAEDGE